MWSSNLCYNNRPLRKLRWNWSKKSKWEKLISLNSLWIMENQWIKTWVWMILIFKKNHQSQKLIKRKKEDLEQDLINTSMKEHQKQTKKLKSSNERRSKRNQKQRNKRKNLKWWFQIQKKRIILKTRIQMNIIQNSI